MLPLQLPITGSVTRSLLCKAEPGGSEPQIEWIGVRVRVARQPSLFFRGRQAGVNWANGKRENQHVRLSLAQEQNRRYSILRRKKKGAGYVV